MQPPKRELEFAAVYAAHAPLVRRTLLHRGVRAADIEDVLQETFVTIHRLLPGFEGRSSVETWLYAIAWRFAAQYHRRYRRDASVDLPVAHDEPPSSFVSAVGVHDSLVGIDEEERDLLLLHDIGGLSTSALSELTGSSRATVRQRIERARNTLVVRSATAAFDSGPQADWMDRFSSPARTPESIAHGPLIRVMECGLVCFSTIDDILICVWRGPASVPALEAVGQEMIDLLAARPDGIRYLSVVEPTSTPPTREGRALNGALARELGPRLKAVAGAVEDSVLMHLAAAVLNSYFFLTRSPVNTRFFRTTVDAIRWLGRYGPADFTAIAHRVETMRAALEPSPARSAKA